MSALFETSQTQAGPTLSERDMLDLLVKRYSVNPGNGSRYAYARHVRSHAGFDARRTADFMAMDLWPSKGLPLHGHEVKVSRSDWLTELRQPEKADEFKQYMNFWWLVTSDPTIVRKDELPADWGLMTVRCGRLFVSRSAPKLDPKPMPRTMLAALLRAIAKTAGES